MIAVGIDSYIKHNGRRNTLCKQNCIRVYITKRSKQMLNTSALLSLSSIVNKSDFNDILPKYLIICVYNKLTKDADAGSHALFYTT